MVEIKGYIPNSAIDWDGKIVAVIFLPMCNLSCGYCHNYDLVSRPGAYETIPFEKVRNSIGLHLGWLDGIVITGGEPLLHTAELPYLLYALRDCSINKPIKLDTNGTFPDRLEKLISKKLIDYVALDYKCPQRQYNSLTGHDVFDSVMESISLVTSSGIDYELRTTLIPGIHTPDVILEMARSIKGVKRWVLQKFDPTHVQDTRFKTLPPFPKEEAQHCLQIAELYIDVCKLRGF